MAVTDILVHIDETENSRARISAAVELARRHDAHLTGFYLANEYLGAGYGGVEFSSAFLESLVAAAKESAGKAKNVFHSLAGNAGARIAWRSERGDAAGLLIEAARFTDLLVIGQAEEGMLGAGATLQNRVLLGAVRPVLMIPHTGVQGALGERVLVAWKESNEAARAVQDALPLLKRADLVQVLTIDPDQYDGDSPAGDLCRHLARHGVDAEALSANANELEISELLLSHIAAHSIDLLVMGAYSHARLRQIIFGGVTRGILQSMTVPVLMSH